MLLPLAPTLETLFLGGNKLGGTITDDIASFKKLKHLTLFEMGLKGTFAQHPAYTRENERTHWGARNEERGTEQNDLKSKGFAPFLRQALRPFPLVLPLRSSPRPSAFPPHRDRGGVAKAAPRLQVHRRVAKLALFPCGSIGETRNSSGPRGDGRGQSSRAATEANVRGAMGSRRVPPFQSARRASRKKVELRRLDFAKLSRCVRSYCGSTRRIGINLVCNHDGRIPHARTRAPCCCKYMKG